MNKIVFCSLYSNDMKYRIYYLLGNNTRFEKRDNFNDFIENV
ncbi:hypothetical protein [Clostridium botulinum]|nr:hypothetical protein [Clostridium botulinum]